MRISAVTQPLPQPGQPHRGGTVTIVTVGGKGTSLLYTPDPDQLTGLGPYTETFQYTLTDDTSSDTATVTINVVPVIRPRAMDDRYTVAEDSGATELDVLDNVKDLFNAGATQTQFEITTAPDPDKGTATIDGRGTLDLADDVIVFTPKADFFGTVTLKYTIDDDYSYFDTIWGKRSRARRVRRR